ncbi:MAG: Eco29kI family restriction endonuclease, partial [Verrucomicrobiae bacterium]|nr:Eco29kI family restriction endonuclease [Verrucomicrobiae bacterium]
GNGESAYLSISTTETPIYVGKADPRNPFAVSLEDQGIALSSRLKEHARNIDKTNLSLDDFWF